MTTVEVRTDVGEAVGLGEPLETAATVFLPDEGAPSVVAFGFPGSGYARRYYSFDLPDAAPGGQAQWHAARGWVFVACDHLGAGDSTIPDDPEALTLRNLAAANAATVEHVLALLRDGAAGLPRVTDPLRLGLGHSMGGCVTIVQQAEHRSFDGIAVLGWSARQVVIPTPTGAEAGPDALAWAFHADDTPRDLVAADMDNYPFGDARPRAWATPVRVPVVLTLMTPGVVAAEAAAVDVPVLVAVGERDICPDPAAEPSAYAAAPGVSLFRLDGAAHLHNFAPTRELLWTRIDAWGREVAAA